MSLEQLSGSNVRSVAADHAHGVASEWDSLAANAGADAADLPHLSWETAWIDLGGEG